MIRINLLGGERHKKSRTVIFDPAQQLTAACTLILVAAFAFVGWWYWSLAQTSTQLDADLATTQQEVTRLQSVLLELQSFEQRRGQLQQRVALIEQLRSGQSVPVQLLDHVSRSLPQMLWLTQMDQEKGEVTIEGRSATLIALSDFVGNLGNTPLLNKPIEIVSSLVESVPPGPGQPADATPVEVITFSVKAQLASPDPAPAGGPGTGAGGGR